MRPSLLGMTSVTRPRGQVGRQVFSSLIKTTSDSFCHFWRIWSFGKYSELHLFQKCCKTCCRCLYRLESETVPVSDFRGNSWRFLPIASWLGVIGAGSKGSEPWYDNGRWFKTASMSVSIVYNSVYENNDFPRTFLKGSLRLRFIRSQYPPRNGLRSVMNLQEIPCSALNFSIFFLSTFFQTLSLNEESSSFWDFLNVAWLSDSIHWQ